MMSMFMMSSMMGGQNPLGNMFGQQSNPITTTVAQVPATPTVDQALDTILKNPDALTRLKDALKSE